MHRAENRHVSLNPVIDRALDRWVEVDQQRRETVYQLQDALTPEAAERRLSHVVSRHVAHSSGIESGLIHLEHTEQISKIEAARQCLQMQPRPAGRWRHRTLDVPQPPGPDFWWVRTDWLHTHQFHVDTLADGLMVTGGLSGEPPRHWLESAPPRRADLQAVAFFLVDPRNIGGPARRRGVSRPLISIRGDLVVNTTREFLPGARSYAECRLHLSHSLFHLNPRITAPQPIVLSEAHTSTDVVQENNTGRVLREPLPGTMEVPAARFQDLDTECTLWARTEVRLDMQIEGAGNFLWFDPAIEIALHQWSVSADV